MATNRCHWLIPTVLLLLLPLALAESCGTNMECVPRKLCQDGIFQDDGRFLITPTIEQTKCSRVLYRCCLVKQKEDNSQTQSQESS